MESTTPEVEQWDQDQTQLASTYVESWQDNPELESQLRTLLYGSGDRDVQYEGWENLHPSLDTESTLPVWSGPYIFHLEKPAGKNHACLYMTRVEDNLRQELIDPVKVLNNGTIDWFYPSPEGQYVAFGISRSGDEQSTLFITTSETGHLLNSGIPHTSFSKVSWLPDASGFYYSGGLASDFENANKYVFFYELSTGRSHREQLELDDPYVIPQVSGNGRYIVVNKSWEKPVSAYYRDRFGDRQWKPFLLEIDGESYGTFYGDSFVALITDGAPNGHIYSVPLSSPEDRSTWKELLPESEAVLRQFTVVGNTLVTSELVDAHSRIRLIDLNSGQQHIVQLPGFGLIESGAPDSCPFAADRDSVYFSYVTFTEPPRLYRLDLRSKELTPLGRKPEVDLSHLAVTLEYYTAYDGSQVPLFLIRRKDLDFSSPRPALLHAYGGWNINLAPSYIGSGRTCVLPFVEAGGLYAYAAIRGGCELGRNWWLQGRREYKQNSFDDFYAGAEYLQTTGYTTAGQLAVMGASNGGLLTAAAVTQRPDLFAVAVAEVPLTDMIRALQGPYVSSYKEEYGSPDDPKMRNILLAYSPIHNVTPNTAYPAVCILSGLSDIRCQTWNGRKLAAWLQHASTSEAPVLFKAVTGGHGPGLSLEEKIERRKYILAFIMNYLGMRLTNR
ncbi:MAG: prolyl oligopeptidase family serine peptidase [Spirochaetota bacterium]